MRIEQARQVYSAQIKEYREQQLLLTKQKQELEQQRKLVKKLEIAYAKAEASRDKSANFLFETYNDAVFFRLRSSFWGG